MSQSVVGADDGLSEYERMRLEKIARNNSYLDSLGLGAPSSKKRLRASADSLPRPAPASRRLPRPYTEVDEALLRRSGRVRGAAAEVKADAAYGALDAAEKAIKGGGREGEAEGDDAGRRSRSSERRSYKAVPEIPMSEKAVAVVTKPSSASSSSRSAKDSMVSISSVVSSMLNKAMNVTGKAAVVELCSGATSFNKYCGIQDFKNCDVLWVNFTSPRGEYHNEFLDGGRKITWFGGSKMHGDSPVVSRLVSRGSASRSGGPAVLLWCRFQEGSYTSPYVCLGRLAYESHDKDKYPVKFVWRLFDFDELNAGAGGGGGGKGKKGDGNSNNFHKFVNF